MAGPGPWSVKGIDDETRDIARAAAGYAGMPIGAWIDRAILRATGEAPRVTASLSAEAVNPESAPPDGATARPTAAEADSASNMVPVQTRNAPEGPAGLIGARPHCLVDTSPPETGAPGVSSVAPGAGPLDVPALISPPVRQSPVIHVPSVHGRGETLRYAFAGVVALLAVAVGANYVDQLMPPPGNSIVERPAEQTAAASVPAPASPAPAAVPPQASVAAVSAPATDSMPAPGSRLDQLSARAAGGEVAAQHELALLYSAGEEIPKDERRAAEWFERAAQQGFPPAQYNIGVVYEQGLGVERNAQMAFSWYRSAADQGHGRAQHNLATLYATGNGIAQNYEEAAKWFSRAADAGVAESLYSLGLMHEHGLGVTRDAATAQTLYRRASEAGVAEAARKLATLPPGDDDHLAAAARSAERIEPSAGPAEARGDGADKTLDRKETAELQRLLRRMDFAPGSADGVAGRRTVAAIKLYQEFAGLPVDGKATRLLLEEMRQVSGTLGRQPRTAGQ